MAWLRPVCGLGALLGALFLLLPSAPAAAQGLTPVVDLSRAAEQIVASVRHRGVSRVAVMPITEMAGSQQAGLGAAVTDGLRQALTLVRLPANYAIDVATASEVASALPQQTLPASARLETAFNVAAAVRAAYVVVGDLQPSGADPHLTLHVYEVATRRGLRTANADITGTLATTPTRGPRPVVIATPEEPFWTPRRLAVAAGFASAGGAAAMAVLTDRHLRAAKRDLLSVPAGAPDLWNAQLAEATGIEKTRDFWWGAAVGLGGLTATYLITRSSPDVTHYPRAVPSGSTGNPRRSWSLRVNPVRPRVVLAYSF